MMAGLPAGTLDGLDVGQGRAYPGRDPPRLPKVGFSARPNNGRWMRPNGLNALEAAASWLWSSRGGAAGAGGLIFARSRVTAEFRGPGSQGVRDANCARPPDGRLLGTIAIFTTFGIIFSLIFEETWAFFPPRSAA